MVMDKPREDKPCRDKEKTKYEGHQQTKHPLYLNHIILLRMHSDESLGGLI